MSTPTNQRQFHRSIDQAPCITVAEFRRLTEKRKWGEDWLTAQCQGALDDPHRIVRDLLTRGRIPDSTVIPWAPLINPHEQVTKAADA
jgi:hypothetical protein